MIPSWEDFSGGYWIVGSIFLGFITAGLATHPVMIVFGAMFCSGIILLYGNYYQNVKLSPEKRKNESSESDSVDKYFHDDPSGEP